MDINQNMKKDYEGINPINEGAIDLTSDECEYVQHVFSKFQDMEKAWLFPQTTANKLISFNLVFKDCKMSFGRPLDEEQQFYFVTYLKCRKAIIERRKETDQNIDKEYLEYINEELKEINSILTKLDWDDTFAL
jgi:hypothetical protein